MNKNMKRAFTITELVIVIAVVAILAAVLIPTFSNLIEKANVSNDTVLVRNLNEALIIAETTEGKPATMHDALTAVAEQGYSVEKLTPRSTGDILWEQTSNRFALVKDNEIVFGDDSTKAEIGYTYWKIVKEMPSENPNNYSLYIAEGFTTAEALTVASGLDVGNNSNIAINYNNANDAQNVIIRTQGGKLSINGLEDTVSHYGTANSVEITAIAGNSYHEYGTILGNINLAQGRVVLENKSEVSSVVVTAEDLTNIAIEDKSGNNTTVAATNETVAGQLATSDKISGTTNVQETVVDETQMSLFAGGIGTEASPYLIATAEQFKNIDSIVADGYYYFEQVEDLVLSSPVNYFKGVYDGGNHSIMAGYKSYIYIFDEMIGHATFKNIELVQSTEHATSLLCVADWGTAFGADFENITITGTTTRVDVGNFGFIVINALYTSGDVKESVIYNFKNITNNVDLQNTGACTGFIVGSGPCFNTATILNFENCVNNGDITGGSVGVGYLYGNPAYIESMVNGTINVVNCVNNGIFMSTSSNSSVGFAPKLNTIEGWAEKSATWQSESGGTYLNSNFFEGKEVHIAQIGSDYKINVTGDVGTGVSYKIVFNVSRVDSGEDYQNNTTKFYYTMSIDNTISETTVLTHKAVDLEKAKEIFGYDYAFAFNEDGIQLLEKDGTMYVVLENFEIGRNNVPYETPGESSITLQIHAFDSNGSIIGIMNIK